MAVIEIAKIQVRRGVENQTGMPRLDAGELGWAQDTEHLYIGKRMSEGAIDDYNTRILTENDLNYFILLSTNSGTISSSYQYKNNGLITTSIDSVITTIQAKLDSMDAGLVDFYEGLGISVNSNVDITAALNVAIANLYGSTSSEYRSRLSLPAGTFNISGPIHLRPYTSLVGAGKDHTVLKFYNSATMQTVDGNDNTFDDGMQQGGHASRNITIEGMSLQFDPSTSGVLVSLDDSVDSRISDVRFGTYFASTSTSTYGLNNRSIGLRLRGSGAGVSGDTAYNKNIHIEDCAFDGINVGIYATGTVLSPVIKDSLFNNLYHGIIFSATDTLSTISNAIISHNRFQNIVNEGILVYNPYVVGTNHVSAENYFVQVGNGSDGYGNVSLDDLTTTAQKAVIAFTSSTGNQSIGDKFHRKEIANPYPTSSTFYYNQLISGSAAIDDNSVYIKTITSQSQWITATSIPLADLSQTIGVRYQMYNQYLSRGGMITINTDQAGDSNWSDDYSYTSQLVTATSVLTSVPGSSSLNVLALGHAAIGIPVPTLTDGNHYIITDAYPGQAALISSVVDDGSHMFVTTVSNGPAFDYANSPSTPYYVAVDESGLVNMKINNAYNAQNFITVEFQNSSTHDITFEYQINTIR
jgi:hypothetical protein